MSFLSRARSSALALVFMASGLSGFAEEPASAVNINRADAQTIADVLDGVGLKKAEAIVAYRQRQGGFKSMVDLADVKGIGLRTVEINEDRIRLK
ncbi:MAG: helix-hairpin-helix domain-containing protein [Pseudomonadaceae bacterium]|nr:helix-hairpin-helix domain-containing protein [Pseudomonadaceae bacterium]